MKYFKNIQHYLENAPLIAGKKIVFTNGCFDILHVGHVRYLKKSRDLGDLLIIGLNSDKSVKRLKGESRPINSESDRAEMLLALSSVNYIILFDEDTPYNLISKLKPDFLTKGGDYKKSEIIGADVIEENGGNVVVFPYLAGKSTSEIINQMNKSS